MMAKKYVECLKIAFDYEKAGSKIIPMGYLNKIEFSLKVKQSTARNYISTMIRLGFFKDKLSHLEITKTGIDYFNEHTR